MIIIYISQMRKPEFRERKQLAQVRDRARAQLLVPLAPECYF